MAEKKSGDLEKIEKLIEIMKRNDLVELEMSHGDNRIVLKRYPPMPPSPPAAGLGPSQQAAPASGNIPQTREVEALSAGPDKGLLPEIKSPIVGTFYATPSPDSEPYVEIGSRVEPQTVVCIIEAMKVMNEIKAEASGTIAEILVTNGQAVEYGQVLFRVRPD
jgi:acetyl-CoA carboxylase biotin carboxyl carrier protein